MNKKISIFIIFILLFSFFKSHISIASEYASEVFSKIRTESQDTPESFGSYSKGCLSGGRYLPSHKFHYDALKPSRNRFWGHPNLINFIEDTSQKVYNAYGNGLLIGDLAMPRGGPMPYGHKSHQNGLDVDIYYQKKPNYELQRFELEIYEPKSMLSKDQTSIQNNTWSDYHYQLLKIFADYERVTRIFVNPVIKKNLCTQAIEKGESSWLKKIRPWGGHYKHFHVRLECPEDSKACKNQPPVNNSDGCGSELDTWLQKEKIYESNSTKIKKWILLSDLPKSCNRLIE